MADQYKVVFRGDIAPGHTLMDARRRLQELFRLDDQGINKLFVGKPIAIKKNLDEATARKWCEVLAKAGAVAEYVAEDNEAAAAAEPDATPGATPTESGWGIAPVGADVLTPAERTPMIDRDIPTPGLSVDAIGADVLREDERTPFHELQLDLSHIRLQDIAPE